MPHIAAQIERRRKVWNIQETFVKAISLARSNTKYEIAGIVVNAYSQSFVLKWDLLDIIEKDAKQMLSQNGPGN